MATVEVSRTLVKSPPELWADLEGDRLSSAVGEVTVEPTEPERSLRFEGEGLRGTAVLEPAGWGTKVILTAEVEEVVARQGLWARMLGEPTPAPRHPEIEQRLTALLDDLGSAHRKPFARG